MNGVFYIGATGLDAQQRAIDAVANNIANVNTSTYKRASVSFHELVTTAGKTEDAVAVAVVPRGVAATPIKIDFSQGQLVTTGEALDLAVRGAGFLQLESLNDQEGISLWRGGRLRVNSDGALANESGVPFAAGIYVPDDAKSLVIGADGRVSALTEDEQVLEIGQLDLVLPAQADDVENLGGGLYRLASGHLDAKTLAAGEEGAGTFAQGFSEAANVELSRELVDLMVHQRAYAASARLVQIGDELMALANGLKR